ncbi:MAG TPA: hypothetical protein VK892_00855 [Pyrinomonadaceae bacterium]|nr:hypothetical protein [Pyrinomonadaceae bacterium]
MKLRSILSVFALSLFLVVSVAAQNETFSDPNVEYTFDLPDAAWKMTSKPSTLSPNVEYVFKDRNDGYMEVRKLSIKSNQMLGDIIRDEETKLQFMPGYVAGKEENFQGALDGRVFNFEFVRSARNMSGRFYFLKAKDDTVYVLRFTGERDKLRNIRNQVDSIARTFKVK